MTPPVRFAVIEAMVRELPFGMLPCTRDRDDPELCGCGNMRRCQEAFCERLLDVIEREEGLRW